MKISRRLQTIFLIAVFIVTIIVPIQRTNASLVTTVSDVMTRLADATLSSHNISFTMVDNDTFAAGETITIDFKEDAPDTYFTVDAAASVVADFDFNDGAERTVIDVDVGAPVCVAGVNNVAVGIVEATGVVTIEACGTYTASGANAVINIEYGTAATGGTNRVTNDDATGSKILDIAGTFGGADTGSFAVVIVADDQVLVQTTIDAYITFSITTLTVTLTAEAVAGNPSYSATGINEDTANTMAANTNAGTGYNITYSGTTLTSGGNTIDAMAARAAGGTPGTEQFGINLRQNTDPSTGANKTGTGVGTYGADYGTVNEFKFVSGDTIATSANASEENVFTMSYIVNVDEDTESGAYQTTITYIATGNF